MKKNNKIQLFINLGIAILLSLAIMVLFYIDILDIDIMRINIVDFNSFGIAISIVMIIFSIILISLSSYFVYFMNRLELKVEQKRNIYRTAKFIITLLILFFYAFKLRIFSIQLPLSSLIPLLISSLNFFSITILILSPLILFVIIVFVIFKEKKNKELPCIKINYKKLKWISLMTGLSLYFLYYFL
jgi:hypothetical protein